MASKTSPASVSGLSASAKPKIILLVDWKVADKPTLAQGLENLGHEVTVLDIPNYDMKNRTHRWGRLVLWWQFARLGYQAAHLARQTGGVVVGINFICGAFAAFFSPLGTCAIGLNLIAHEKGRLNQYLRKFVYDQVFSSRRLIATANSEYLCKKYQREFKVREDQIQVLHDAWSPRYAVKEPVSLPDSYIFSGGEAARDWDTVLAAAQAFPDQAFLIIARKMTWKPEITLPPNVNVQFDVDEAQFYAAVERAKLVLLPVKGEVTAGLIVMIRSALLGKLVLTTNNAVMRDYFPDDLRFLLAGEGDIDAVCKALQLLLAGEQDVARKAKIFQRYILETFSPQNYACQVSSMVSEIAEAR